MRRKTLIDTHLVQKYLRVERRPQPYPWQPRNGDWGTTTPLYTKMLLDALAGDDRRTDLRRLYRLYQIHQKPDDVWRQGTYWMLVECCYDLCFFFPAETLARYLPAYKQYTQESLSHGLD